MSRHQNVVTIEKFGASPVQDEGNRHPEHDEAFALGSSDLAAMLRREHLYIASLLDRLSVDDVAEDRNVLWKQTLTELVAHGDAEEDTVYSKLVRAMPRDGLLKAILEMHGRIRDLLQEMVELDPRGSRFSARLEKLQAWFAQNIRAQDELLLIAAQVLGLSALDDMCSSFLDRKMDLLYTA